MKPLRKFLLRDLLILIGLLACASALIGWRSAQKAQDRQIQARARENLSRLSQDLQATLRLVERVGNTTAQWWREGQIRFDGIPEAEARLAPLMDSFPEVANLVLVFNEGWGLTLGRTAEGLSSYHLDARQETARKRYLRKGGKALAETFWEPTPFRPFQRPWFHLAKAWPHARWVDAYRFVDRGTHGLSYTVPLRGPGGEFMGALCVDIFLDSLNHQIQSARPTSNSLVLVSDEGRRALLLSQGPLATPRGPDFSILSPDQLPLLHELQVRWEAAGRPQAPQFLRWDGHEYTTIATRMQGIEGVNWTLSLAVPDGDYRGSGVPMALGILLATSLVTAFGYWRARRLAAQLADPLEALGAAAEKLAEGHPPPPLVSEFLEVQSLSEALQRASRALEQEAELQLELQHSQRVETLGTLAGGIAHDVNNQLAGIVGQLNLGREYLEPAHPAHLRMLRAEESAHACGRMISALLGFSRKGRPERSLVDLNRLVRHTATLVERLLGGRIRLELELAPHLGELLADPVGIEQVLMNLAVNARDAMPEGGTLSIRTRLSPEGEVTLEVRDTGQGIPPELQARIFDPFFTTKEVGKGSGLGLAMVSSIVRAHGGRVEVESRPGEGSAFRIILSDPTRDEVGIQPKPGPPADPEATFEGCRILVADDEAALRELLIEGFSSRGAQVQAAQDGHEAWLHFQEAAWDLVVSDQRMPRMTGLELLERIRTRNALVPVILISGFGLEGAQEAASRDPRLRLLTKPFAFKALFTQAQELLRPPAEP